MRALYLALLGSAVLLAQTLNPLTEAVAKRYESAKQNLIGTAEAMPEADYSYKLTPAQRPFSGWIEHTAMGNYHFCSAFSSAPPPDMSKLHGMTAKADLQKTLQESFDYCDVALKSLDDQKALTEKDGKYPALDGMIGLITSLNEHYGNLVGYLRTKGITPPSSAHSKRK